MANWWEQDEVVQPGAAPAGGNWWEQDQVVQSAAPKPAPGPAISQPTELDMLLRPGQVQMDSGEVRQATSPLVMQFADNPRIQAAQQLQRGTLAGEAAAFQPMMREAFNQTLIPSMIDYQNSGAADRQAAEDARWRAQILEGGLDQLDPRQRQMALLDPMLAQQQMGLDIPERSTTPELQRQQAVALEQAAAPKAAQFAQNQLIDRAEEQAIPSFTTAQGPLAQTFAGAGSLAANLIGGLPAVENLVPVSRGATLAKTFARGAGVNAATAALADPLVQANQIATGMQERYSPEQTALAAGVGGVAGGALNALPQIPSALRGWIEGRASKRIEDMAPNEAARWLEQARAASEAAGRDVTDPEFQAQQVQQNTGLDLARPTDPASVAAQRAANRVRGRELAETFDDVNIWPREQVEVGPEGVEIPEGVAPVRDAAGEQARIDTLAPRGIAAAMARELGMENPTAQELDAIVTYMQNGLSPRGAVNAFRRAATQGQRGERGMTPDLERTAGEQANSRQFAKEAFDIAELRRQRREAELNQWEPDLQPDYSAGAGRADDLTPRMAQDLAARSQEPAPGVGSQQPAPRRSVDVIGSKSVGGLRGEYLPGERPAPDAPSGRAGETFAAERTEPALEAPVGRAADETPSEATAVDEVRGLPKPRREKPAPATTDTASRVEWEAYDRWAEENASPELRAQLDELDAKADAAWSEHYRLANRGSENYHKGNPTPENALKAERAHVENSRLRLLRTRLLRDGEDNPIQLANYRRQVQELEAREARMAAEREAEAPPTPETTTTPPVGDTDAQLRQLEHELSLSRYFDDTPEEIAALERKIADLKRPAAPEPKTEKPALSLEERRQTPEGRAATYHEKLWKDYQGWVRHEEDLHARARAAKKDPELQRLADWATRDRERFETRFAKDLPIARERFGEGAKPQISELDRAKIQDRELTREMMKARTNNDLAGARKLRAEQLALRDRIDALEGRKPTKARERAKADVAERLKPKSAATERLGADLAKALRERLGRVNWDERGGQLLRDTQGNVTGRTKWLSNDPDVQAVLSQFRYSTAEAQNLLERAATGKGRPLTEKQQRFVDDLVTAHQSPSERAGDDFDLETHTESDLSAREQEQQTAAQREASTRKAAEDKAQADKDRDDFTLTGSDRPADVGASRGQSTLFDVTGAAVHGGKTALNAVGKGLKALTKAVWQGDDNRTAREHAGDLAEPIAQLIERRGPAVEGRTRAALRKFFASAEGSLRSLASKTDSPTAKQLADVFHATAGEGKGVGATLDERSQMQLFGGKKGYMNRAEEIHNFLHDNGLDDAKSVDQIVKLVENPGTPRRGKIGEAATMISDFFKDAHKYLKDAGIDMGEVKGYFPREHDVSLVESKRVPFIDAATKAYKTDNPALSPTDAREKAEAYWSAVVHGEDTPPGAGGRASPNPKPDFMKGRVFSKEAAKHLEPFYTRKIGGMLSNYALRAVRRAEVAKSGVQIGDKFQPFGDNFANWDKVQKAIQSEDPKAREVMDQINQLVSVNAGIPTTNYGRNAENALSWVRTAGTLGMLEKSALASVGELATSPLRGAIGDAGDIANIAKNLGGHAVNTLRAVVGKKGRSKAVKEAFEFSDEIGATTESQQGSTAAARFEGNDPGSQVQNKLLTSFFKRNMLTPLTEYTRAMSAQQARIFMKRLASDKQRANGNQARSDLFLRELGVPKGKEQAFADYVRQFGDKLPTAAELKGPMGDIYKNAALRFTDQSVQRPNSATKPAWASHPLGKMIFQFQSFNYAFQKNVLNRMVRLAVMNKELSAAQKAKLGASFGLSVGAMTGIQAMITELREAAYSRPDQKALTPGAKLEGTISRSGLLGTADPWIQLINGGIRYGRDPGQTLLGPTLGQASQTLGTFLGPNAAGTNTAERARARALYQTFGEPALQAALSATPAGPLSKAATVYGVPKLGELLTDKFIPDNKKRTASDAKPIKGMVESVSDLFGEKERKPGEL